MAERTREPMKLERSPLVLVLAQVRFAPVALMGDYIPRIQDALRREGFVWFQEERMQEVVLGPNPEGKAAKRWIFSSRQKDEAAVLAPDFVAYETSAYDVFETFTTRLRTLLEVVREKAEVALSSRIGLRYVNLIRETDGMSSRELLQPSIQGLTCEQLGTEECRHHSFTEARTPQQGTIRVQTIESTGQAVLPPDLTNTRLELRTRPDETELFRILDIDHFSKANRDFDPKTIEDALWDLHEYTEKAFRSTVTEDAIQIWRKGEAS